MKTAIQHVASDLYDIDLSVDDHAKVMLLLVKHFDTTEKQQIIDAYQHGYFESNESNKDSDTYYTSTFNTTNK